jgi:hypothetical protein
MGMVNYCTPARGEEVHRKGNLHEEHGEELHRQEELHREENLRRTRVNCNSERELTREGELHEVTPKAWCRRGRGFCRRPRARSRSARCTRGGPCSYRRGEREVEGSKRGKQREQQGRGLHIKDWHRQQGKGVERPGEALR